jgi:hypothetical protein
MRVAQNKKRRIFEEEKAAKQMAHILEEDEDIVVSDLPHELRLQVYRGANPNDHSFYDLFPDAYGSARISFEMDITESEDVYGAIYAITLPGSDKVYVGQTTKSVAERFKGHWNRGAKNSCGTDDYRELLGEARADLSKRADIQIYLLDMVRIANVPEELGIEGAQKILNEKENAWMFKLFAHGYELFNTRVRITPAYYADAIEYMKVAVGSPSELEELCIGSYVTKEDSESSRWVFEPAV